MPNGLVYSIREKANHPPVAGVNGGPKEKIHRLSCEVNEVHSFDASASTDTDGDVLS